jgi:hypothetical protein
MTAANCDTFNIARWRLFVLKPKALHRKLRWPAMAVIGLNILKNKRKKLSIMI